MLKLADTSLILINPSPSNVKTKTKKQFMYTSCSPDVLSLKFSIFMKNLSSYCGLVDTKIRASEIDLPVYQIVSVTICVQNA